MAAMAPFRASSCPKSDSSGKLICKQNNCVQVTTYLSLNCCSALIPSVVFLQPGHNTAETQICCFQIIQLKVCETQEYKTSLALALSLSQPHPLPSYLSEPHSHVFGNKTQNRASQLLQTVITLTFILLFLTALALPLQLGDVCLP